MSNSLWSTLKKNGINLVPIRPSNPLLHPSVHGYPIKKCILISFTSRLSKENKRKEEIYLSRTVLLLIFAFWLISEFSRVFAATLVCYGVNGLFLFVLTGFVFNVIFRFHFFFFFYYHSNMHACTFFCLFVCFFFFSELGPFLMLQI